MTVGGKPPAVVLDIDVQGAENVRRRIPESLAVFILPPDEHELLKRLRSRGREDEEAIQRRFAESKREIARAFGVAPGERHELKRLLKDLEGDGTLETLAARKVGAIALGHVASPFELRGAGNSDLGAVAASGLFLAEDGRTGSVSATLKISDAKTFTPVKAAA